MQESVTDHGTLFSERVRAEIRRLSDSINAMMENMRRMRNPIFESQQRLPQANEQLDKISAQTEAATHQMLDIVEQILEHQDQIVKYSVELTAFLDRSRARDREAYREKLRRINEMASNSQNNACLIMDALQFQDITAQQMGYASALLEDIELRLKRLLAVYDGREITEDAVELPSRRAFDPDADLFDGRGQKEVDSIVSEIVNKD